MPRRDRPHNTHRSEHWLRVAINEVPSRFNAQVARVFAWEEANIEWLSPVMDDDYAEYYDAAFLEGLGISSLRIPLGSFWPAGGPRWDGLGRTSDGKLILVEAKAYIEEAVDYRSKASPGSFKKISQSLAEAKNAFNVTVDAPWETPFYQYANRLAHLYFLHELNGLDAYLLFLYFADAPDVPDPCSENEWKGAARLNKKCLGLGKHRFETRIGTLIWSVGDMLADDRGAE
jgi:hypothetical protein